MSPRVRLGLWGLAVAGCGVSAVLFRLVAPWAGAAWQCACLGGILALYATTPPDAIKLPKWVSKAVIVSGMAGWPWLCTGRLTWAMGAAVVVVLALDHLLPRQQWPDRRGAARLTWRWSWSPGVASDWLSTIMLWSPASWIILAGGRAFQNPEWALPACVYVLLMLLVLQGRERPTESPSRLQARIGVAMVFWAMGVLAAAGYAGDPSM